MNILDLRARCIKPTECHIFIQYFVHIGNPNDSEQESQKVVLRDRKRCTAHGVSCPWRVLSGEWGGRGGGCPCPGTWLGYPHPHFPWERTWDQSLGYPPPLPRKGLGTRYQGRNLGPEAMGYPSPRWTNLKHYVPSYFVRKISMKFTARTLTTELTSFSRFFAFNFRLI